MRLPAVANEKMLVLKRCAIKSKTSHGMGRMPSFNNNNNNNNNNTNNVTSMALKYSEARAQKRNKTKSIIIFKSRGHTWIIISFKGPPTI